MKRSAPLRRHAPLASGAPLERKTRLAPVNRERRAKLRAIQFGAHADVIRSLPCCACGRPGPSDPHHVRSRGAGGDRRHIAPLCRADHDALHRMGRASFEAARSVDLAAVAAELWARHGEEVGA